MLTRTSTLLLALGLSLATAAQAFALNPQPLPPGRAPTIATAYDIKAELVFYPSLSAYVVQIRNVGPVIPGPIQGKFSLSVPAGTKVTNWTLNGWQCSPSPPVAGAITIACTISVSAAWAAGTILSNQLFFVSFQPGIKPGMVCVRSQALKPSPSGVYQPIAETNTANNSLCV